MPDLWDTNPDSVFSRPDSSPIRSPAITTTPRRCGSRTVAASSGFPRTC